MAPSDSEGDDDDRTTDADGEDGQDIDDDGDAVEADAVAEDLTDGDEVCLIFPASVGCNENEIELRFRLV